MCFSQLVFFLVLFHVRFALFVRLFAFSAHSFHLKLVLPSRSLFNCSFSFSKFYIFLFFFSVCISFFIFSFHLPFFAIFHAFFFCFMRFLWFVCLLYAAAAKSNFPVENRRGAECEGCVFFPLSGGKHEMLIKVQLQFELVRSFQAFGCLYCPVSNRIHPSICRRNPHPTIQPSIHPSILLHIRPFFVLFPPCYRACPSAAYVCTGTLLSASCRTGAVQTPLPLRVFRCWTMPSMMSSCKLCTLPRWSVNGGPAMTLPRRLPLQKN